MYSSITYRNYWKKKTRNPSRNWWSF